MKNILVFLLAVLGTSCASTDSDMKAAAAGSTAMNTCSQARDKLWTRYKSAINKIGIEASTKSPGCAIAMTFDSAASVRLFTADQKALHEGADHTIVNGTKVEIHVYVQAASAPQPVASSVSSGPVSMETCESARDKLWADYKSGLYEIGIERDKSGTGYAVAMGFRDEASLKLYEASQVRRGEGAGFTFVKGVKVEVHIAVVKPHGIQPRGGVSN